MCKIDTRIYHVLLEAARNAIREMLLTNETFYYCSLVMLDDATPCITAWSEEALNRFIRMHYGTEKVPESEKLNFRWSYADSPYYAFGYNKYFADVEKLFEIDYYTTYDQKISVWLQQMENVMKSLDEEGIFSVIGNRKDIFINAEKMPPDESNILRGKRLNPAETFRAWYEDNWAENDSEDLYEHYYSLHHPQTCKVVVAKPISDKGLAMKIRRDFNVTLGINEFIAKCNNTPIVINEDFDYDLGKKILSEKSLYSTFVLLEKNEKQ
ncbi:MAG: DUF4303 domain-containing protein [Ruminococcus sp.]|nr:DUF4303 domain-containing protein [Ruminococcus sp.]